MQCTNSSQARQCEDKGKIKRARTPRDDEKTKRKAPLKKSYIQVTVPSPPTRHDVTLLARARLGWLSLQVG